MIPGLPEEMARECLSRLPYQHFRAARSVCKQWKLELESAYYHRFRRTSGLTRTVIALVQAEPASSLSSSKHVSSAPVYRLSLYEPDTAAWSALPPVPGLPHGLPLFCQVAAAGRQLVVIGGWDPQTWAASDAVFIYDFATGAWRQGAPMPGPRRSFFACGAAGDSVVVVAGGHDERKDALRSAVAYDVAEDQWAPLPDMARERDECKGFVLRGRFHVVGGYGTDSQGRFGRCGEAFDLSTWQWGPVDEEMLENPTCPRTCVVGSDGRMYMCTEGHVAARESEKAWRRVAELPGDVRVALQAVPWDRNVVVMGSGKQGGAQVAYTLEMGKDGSGLRWSTIEMPLEFSGHVQAGCCLQI